MRYFKEFLLLLSAAFICYPAFVQMHVTVKAGNFATDLGHLETSEKADAGVAAAEFDILMPPIDYTEGVTVFADVTIAALQENESIKLSSQQAPNCWQTLDVILFPLGMFIVLMVMLLFAHRLW